MKLKDKYTFDYIESKGLLLFKCITGSHAYGTNTETSDEDIKAVFMCESDDLFGFKDIPSEVADDKQDMKYYEIGTLIKLLMKSNPNILEILNVSSEHILYCHPLFQKYIINNKNLFISKLCRDTFAGYSVSQIKKARGLNKKIVNPFPKEKKDLIDFCYVIDQDKTYPLKKLLEKNNLNQLFIGVQKLDHAQDLYALYYDRMAEANFIDESPETIRHREANRADENSIMGYGFKGIVNYNDPSNTNQIRLSSIPEITENNRDKIEYVCLISYNQGAYSRYCLDYSHYWKWVNERNETRYNENIENGSDFDAKNMSHCIRLLNMCLDLFKTNQIVVKRPEREFLLDIRNHKLDYDSIIRLSESKLKEIDEAVRVSNIQDTPDEETLQKLLILFRKEFYNFQRK